MTPLSSVVHSDVLYIDGFNIIVIEQLNFTENHPNHPYYFGRLWYLQNITLKYMNLVNSSDTGSSDGIYFMLYHINNVYYGFTNFVNLQLQFKLLEFLGGPVSLTHLYISDINTGSPLIDCQSGQLTASDIYIHNFSGVLFTHSYSTTDVLFLSTCFTEALAGQSHPDFNFQLIGDIFSSDFISVPTITPPYHILSFTCSFSVSDVFTVSSLSQTSRFQSSKFFTLPINYPYHIRYQYLRVGNWLYMMHIH